MANVITHEDHTYKHFNRAMGIQIESKKHYEYEMNRRGFVPFELGQKIAQEANKTHKDIKQSRKAVEVIRAIQSQGKGTDRFRPDSRTIKAMEEVGVGFDYYKKLPSHYEKSGGFYDAV